MNVSTQSRPDPVAHGFLLSRSRRCPAVPMRSNSTASLHVRGHLMIVCCVRLGWRRI